jgi:7-cyano-7-deazaguanine reductase
MKKEENLEIVPGQEIKTYAFESKTQKIKLETDEFSCICPESSLPDNATLIIEYFPKGKALDLSSLKEYMVSFRNVKIRQEEATKKIYEDLKKALSHNQITITTLFNTKNGIDVTCVESGVKGVITGY